MVCINCGASTQVTNSRRQIRLNQIWRRRQCDKCGHCFTTHEIIDLSTSLMVITDSGALEPFSREDLFIGIYESLKHLPQAVETSRLLAQTVIGQVMQHAERSCITQKSVLEITSLAIGRFDKTAGVIYRAYHKESLRNKQ